MIGACTPYAGVGLGWLRLEVGSIWPAVVAFRKDWMSNTQRNRDLSRSIDAEDAGRIAETVRTGVADLYINAPDVAAPGRSRTYVMSAGEATLVLEMP